MNLEFNPLESKLLFAKPKRLHKNSGWTEHIPFAMLLVETQQPSVIVELGTHQGNSYCAWCQAVVAAGIKTQCYAVDTWAGDDHAGSYGNDVFENLKEHHKQYESFSKLLRMKFDEALVQIADHSVDLLHIDGLHTYDAVKHDYDSWFPKMSDRGIVLFHDTVVVERGFGVHRFWKELAPRYPHFNFEHGFGLGILAVGKKQPEAVVNLLRSANDNADATRELFAALGRRFQNEELRTELNRLKGIEHSRDYMWGRKLVAPFRKVKRMLVNNSSDVPH